MLKVDNAAVREEQIAKLRRLRAERDEDACRRRWSALTRAAAAARTGPDALDDNLLALADRRRPGDGHGRRDHRRAGAGLRPPHRADPYDHRRVPRGGRRVRRDDRGARPPSRSSSEPRAAGRASWSPRWARTATTAARR